MNRNLVDAVTKIMVGETMEEVKLDEKVMPGSNEYQQKINDVRKQYNKLYNDDLNPDYYSSSEWDVAKKRYDDRLDSLKQKLKDMMDKHKEGLKKNQDRTRIQKPQQKPRPKHIPLTGYGSGRKRSFASYNPSNEQKEIWNEELQIFERVYIMGEKKEKTVRQLVDPKKEVMVVKKNNVIVIDKKDQDKYMKMGYTLAEKEKLDPVNKDALKKKFDDRKDKDIDNDGDVDSTDKYLHTRRKAVSKAISKENYEIGKDYGKHTRDVTPGQSNDDFEKMVGVMQKKNNSMREALAKVWNTTEGKNPFQKTEGEHKDKKTMTGKPVTRVEVDPKVEEKKKSKKNVDSNKSKIQSAMCPSTGGSTIDFSAVKST